MQYINYSILFPIGYCIVHEKKNSIHLYNAGPPYDQVGNADVVG